MLKESYLEKLGSSLKAKTVAATALVTIVLSAISVQVNPAGLAGEDRSDGNKESVSMFYKAGAGEVRDKAFYDGLAQKAEDELFPKKAYGEVIRLLEPYANNKDNRSASFYNNLGAAYYKIKKYSTAEQYLRYAIKIESNRMEAHFNLGATYAKQRRYESALEEFNYVLSNNPNHKNAQKWKQYIFKKLSAERR